MKNNFFHFSLHSFFSFWVVLTFLFFSSFSLLPQENQQESQQENQVENIFSTSTKLPSPENFASSPNQKEFFRLKFSHQHGNYLVFYDDENIPIYLQFRWDRFDRESNHVLHRIRRGIDYFAKLSLVEVTSEPPPAYSTAKKIPPQKPINNENTFRTREYKKVFVGILYRLRYTLPQRARF